MMPIVADTVHDAPGLAYTDGTMIGLPQWINSFADPKEPLQDNRNLAMYSALALHEAGHILGGTFAVDLRQILARKPHPRLYQFIHNVLEDFRVELFIKTALIHPQVKDLIDGCNRYLGVMNFRQNSSGKADFFDLLVWMADQAAGINEELDGHEAYRAMMKKLFDADLPCGRFPSVRHLADYGLERLRHLDCRNILAVHQLAQEFHEILRHWPETYINLQQDRVESRLADAPGPGLKPQLTPLDPDDLKRMYDECNRDPVGFLNELGLKALANLGAAENEGPAAGGEMRDAVLLGPIDYEDEGTVDQSTRTRIDELIAHSQLEAMKSAERDKKKASLDFRQPKKRKAKAAAGDKGPKVRRIRSVDPRTRSRTRLSQVAVYPVQAVNHEFLRRCRRWDRIADQVSTLLAELLPREDDRRELSATDGEIDMESLVEILSDRRAIGAQEFLEDLQEGHQRDIEAIIGLDCSGSTDGQLEGGLTVLDIEKSFALIFGNALKQLSPRVRCLAFNSGTSTNIYEAQTLEALSSFQSDHANRDGDFIRYVTEELRPSSAASKFFFLLSDGQPASINYSGKEALDDTLMAMRECRREGIRLVYLNVDAYKSEYFHAFAAECTYARRFESPVDLMPAIPGLVRTIVEGTG
jgi:hypothetical protein